MEYAKLYETDKELMDIFENFSINEVKNDSDCNLPEKTRYEAVLAALIGCGGVDMFREVLSEAIESSVLSAVEAREIVYQAVDYLGMGRVLPFLYGENEVFSKAGVKLPLPDSSTVSADERLEKGVEAQVHIFGEHMREAWKAGKINRRLGANCFGDFYTRTGLSLKERELITFCFLMAQGGCEPQLTAHAKGNMNLGNDRDFLMRVVYQCLPYIGYPRSLNAISCVNKAAE